MKLQPRTADRLSGLAEEYYNPELAYHNWGHAEEVMVASRDLINQGGRWTRHVNRPLLQIAAAWHDAGHDYEARHNFESPEHYSAYLMRQRLQCELPMRQLNEIEETILGTRHNQPRRTMAAIALRYGDVGNMAAPFDNFYEHSVQLWREYGMPDWLEFQAASIKMLASVRQSADRELPRIGIFGRHCHAYTDAVAANLARLGTLEVPSE